MTDATTARPATASETRTPSSAAGELASRAPSKRQRRRHRVRRLTKRDKIVLALMLGIPTLVELALVWGPAVATVFLSFTNAASASPVKNVGTQNYHYLRTIDPEFWPAVRHNIIWLLVFAIVATPLGMFFAVLLDRGIRGSRVYQSVFFLPVMLSLALIGIIWNVVFNSDFGVVNGFLHDTHLHSPVSWYGPDHDLTAVLIEASWRQAGYVMVLYLAGLKAVDPALREAAALDGANAWQTFWQVVFPVLRPINIVIVVVTVIESLRAFDLVYITNGGTNGLELLSAEITQLIVGPANLVGRGSALGVVLLVISLVPISFFLVQQFRKEKNG